MRNRIPLLLAAILLLILTFAASCKDTDDVTERSGNKVNEFLQKIRDNACNLYCIPCIPERIPSTRSVDDICDSNIIYVSDPNISIINDEQGCDSVKRILTSSHTVYELVEYTKLFGLHVSVSDTVNTVCNVFIDEDSARVALDPILEESRSYLYAKGFSDYEIQEMLNETGSDESLLVPLVLELVSIEKARDETFNHIKRNNISIMDVISTRAFAQINWQKAGGCATAVFIGELREALLNKTITKSTLKVVLKTALRKIATRLVGPVGAILAIAEFSICMWS